MDWDDKLYWFLRHAHWAAYGHFLWGTFVIFPRETGELICKFREAVMFWKKLGKEGKMGWVAVLKDAPKIIGNVEAVAGDIAPVEAEASTSPAVQKLVADLKTLIESLKEVEL